MEKVDSFQVRMTGVKSWVECLTSSGVASGGRRADAQRDSRILVQVLGSPNDVTVGVTVDVETSSNLKTTRSQDPNTQVVVSETIREESSNKVQPEGFQV